MEQSKFVRRVHPLLVSPATILTRDSALEAAKCLPRKPPDEKVGTAGWLHDLADCVITLDYFGKFKEAADLLDRCYDRSWLEDVRTAAEVITEKDFLVGRAKVWAVLAYVQSQRRHPSPGPEEVYSPTLLGWVESCIKYINSRLRVSGSKERACLGTLAHAFAIRGFLSGDLGLVAEADSNFSEALDKCFEKHEPDDAREVGDRLIVDRFVSRVQILGSAWLKMTKGALDEAQFVLTSARGRLDESDQELLAAFARMMRGCIARAKAGNNEATLCRAIAELITAKEVFRSYEHKSYAARASFELALAHYHLGNLAAAETFRQEAGSPQEHGPWNCNLLILQSRIQRRSGCLPDAVHTATDALEVAQQFHSPAIQEARVALGEALLDVGDHDAAIESFRSALDQSGQNPKLRAICLLHLARAHQKMGSREKAHQAFSQYQQLEPTIQNGFVKDYAGDIKRELNDVDMLVVRSDDNLSYSINEMRLRRFLIHSARQRYGDVSQILSALGISRQSFYNWQRQDTSVVEVRTPNEVPSALDHQALGSDSDPDKPSIGKK